MDIIEPKSRAGIQENNKASNAFIHLNQFLAEIRTKDIPAGIVATINDRIEEFNALPDKGTDYRRHISKMQSKIYTILEKELGMVPKDYYKHRWLALGMAAFGLPIGVAIGTMMGNVGFMGVGLPIGLAVGAAVGAQKDKKAFEEGKQLDIKM